MQSEAKTVPAEWIDFNVVERMLRATEESEGVIC